ncbi:hypothetical protein [Nocardia sp. NPDC003963]
MATGGGSFQYINTAVQNMCLRIGAAGKQIGELGHHNLGEFVHRLRRTEFPGHGRIAGRGEMRDGRDGRGAQATPPRGPLVGSTLPDIVPAGADILVNPSGPAQFRLRTAALRI